MEKLLSREMLETSFSYWSKPKGGCGESAHQLFQPLRRIVVSMQMQGDEKPDPQTEAGKVCSQTTFREKLGDGLLLLLLLLLFVCFCLFPLQ